MNAREVVNDPKLWQAISGGLTTAILGYFGYVEIQNREDVAAPSVDVTFEAPAVAPAPVAKPVVPKHEHPVRTSKDWGLVIDAKDEALRKHLVDEYHGGD